MMRLSDFGNTMKMYRAAHKMTQETLADVLGVQTKYISLLECGRRNPGAKLQKKMEELMMIDEVEGIFRQEKAEASKEDVEIQLKLFYKLNRLQPAQREKAVQLICQILDAMAGKSPGR